MTSPLLAELEARRARLFERLAAIGDFRRGSISENYRRCGKPNCRRHPHPRCAADLVRRAAITL
ncbi:MAG TPA: DUF6788 family protein [Streptosporangiaceae bacterium]|nr:DUF6788 family protein [Streptosporangiaceae bacterium]